MENTHYSRPIITAYCLDWHITTSGAMHDLLINALGRYVDIRQVAWTGKEELPPPKLGETLIFFMLPPTDDWLEKYHDFQIIWIPMADAILYSSQMKHHPSIRIVTFSRATQDLADMLGLPSFRIRYYPNPDNFPVAEFKDERVMLYWNRTGFFYKRFIVRLCKELSIDRLIFRDILDPRIPMHKRYQLPDKIGNTVVETYSEITSYEAYLELLNTANIFIAPRKLEGVGLAFLEAMARGCCVIGYNEVAMNEYITHNKNGILFSPMGEVKTLQQFTYELFYRIINKISWKLRHRAVASLDLTLMQDWKSIREINIVELGANARQAMIDGYQKWIARIPAYAEFVIGKN